MRSDAGRTAPGVEMFDLGCVEDMLVTGRVVVNLEACGIEILVVRTRRGVVAVENRCPHMGLSLEGATVRGRKLICAHHGRRYDLTTACYQSSASAGAHLRRYETSIENGHLLVWVFRP